MALSVIKEAGLDFAQCVEKEKVPSLFLCSKGGQVSVVGEAIVVTNNPLKSAMIEGFIEGIGLIRGCESLQVVKEDVVGKEEAIWHRADLVAQDKVNSKVRQLQKEHRFGPERWVGASDVMVWIDEKPYHNLSRLDSLSEDDLNQEAERLKQIFGVGNTEVMYDVAFAVSRSGGKVCMATRYVVEFGTIDSRLIDKDFFENIGLTKKRSTRIGLIDNFGDFVVGVPLQIPLGVVIWGNDFKHEGEWRDRLKPVDLKLVQASVLGGFPLGDQVEGFLQAPLKGDQNGYLLL